MLHRADHGDDVGLDHAVDLGDLVQQHPVAVGQFCICIAFSASTVVTALAVCSNSISPSMAPPGFAKPLMLGRTAQ
jgi:hypothetical protein